MVEEQPYDDHENQVQKSMAMVEWNNRKSFYLDFHIGLESNDYIIWQRLGFDEFILTLI